ncbi:hypothetical protein [Runella slithyformis]|uniref:Uncharacterized protein n=1 Tax=Runella slithyformis (strain ATCC 29530 / DSM 19594 / LMG 11500 / NCIMB 11436 / LSU 4) TaxID=761193 RepID=A0A7U3ZNX2_RUNSL|nr:hypothetical protein [Runella slithyformis]AEI50680.1 hypothetical protein Runsl_4348 [Runella slithyformis DSM 19594]
MNYENKKLTSTTAKLPENEQLIGGDANPELFNKRDVKQIDRELQEYLRNRQVVKRGKTYCHQLPFDN